MSGILAGGFARLVKAPKTISPGRRVGAVLRLRGGALAGQGRISGTVMVAGTPAARRVRAYDVVTGVFVGETWSGADGIYTLDHLNPARKYLVVGHDHLAQYNAAVADLIEPEPIP